MAEEDRKRVAESLKRARMRAGLLASEAAELIGIRPQLISYYEVRGTTPSIEVLIAMRKVYGVSVEELLGLSDLDEIPNDAGKDARRR